MTEYQRFTVRQVTAGETQGWAFAAGWFQIPGSAGPWAWFFREGDDLAAHVGQIQIGRQRAVEVEQHRA